MFCFNLFKFISQDRTRRTIPEKENISFSLFYFHYIIVMLNNKSVQLTLTLDMLVKFLKAASLRMYLSVARESPPVLSFTNILLSDLLYYSFLGRSLTRLALLPTRGPQMLYHYQYLVFSASL
jgi:hypothetical protein